jgi:hypothetical protein
MTPRERHGTSSPVTGGDGMEPLALLAILVAIICVGYILATIVFKIISTILDFVESNKLAIIVIIALMLAFWLGHPQF